MLLYSVPSSCSQIINIAMRMAGITPELIGTDLQSGVTSNGKKFEDINPNKYVPAIIREDGKLLTETTAILLNLDAEHPEKELLPTEKEARRIAIEWLVYMSTELHKPWGFLFYPHTPEEFKTFLRERLAQRSQRITDALSDGRSFILGERFSVVDAYIAVVFGWGAMTDIDVHVWPGVSDYLDRVSRQRFVMEAREAEQALQAA